MVIRQPAGLHITVRWVGGPSEQAFSIAAKEQGIIVRPLEYYEHMPDIARSQREWRSVVLGLAMLH